MFDLKQNGDENITLRLASSFARTLRTIVSLELNIDFSVFYVEH